MEALPQRDRNKILRELQGKGHLTDKKPVREKPRPTPAYRKRAQEEIERSKRALDNYDHIYDILSEPPPESAESVPEPPEPVETPQDRTGCGTLLWPLLMVPLAMLILGSPVWPIGILVLTAAFAPIVVRVFDEST